MKIWTEKDRMALLAFLNTETGSKVCDYLRDKKSPSLRTSAAPHEGHIDLGQQIGFDLALDEFEALSQKPPEPPQSSERGGLHNTRSQ